MRLAVTSSEHEVARLWASGLSCAAIATRRGTSRSTTCTLLQRAKARLGVQDRRALAIRLAAGVAIDERPRTGRPLEVSRFGYRPGERVRIIGGRYAGRYGVYRAAHSGLQVKVRISFGVVAVMARFVESMERTAADPLTESVK